jgi:hypothetical protein
MAKSSSFFGVRRGSTKAHTFSVYRGQQITKDRVTNITNPQTSKQMAQRVKLPLVAAARSILSGIINHSWQGVDYGYKSKARFSSLNLANLSVLSYGAKGLRTTGIANYIVSEGSITPLPVFLPQEDDNLFSLQVSSSTKAMTMPTSVNDVIDIILASSDLLEEGDQLTFLYADRRASTDLTYIATDSANNFGVCNPQWDYCRLILKHDADENAAWEFEESDDNEWMIFQKGKIMVGSTVATSASGNLYISITPSLAGTTPLMFTCITSRYNATTSTWQRSTNRMSVNEYALTVDPIKSLVVDETTAAQTYIKSSSASSDYYLNEGTTA